MRLGAFPEPWPPAGLGAVEPIALLDRAYAELAAEFARPDAADPRAPGTSPTRRCGFWIRRMAQETVIHRVDAELALGSRSPRSPTTCAVDGIDEVLKLFVGYGSHAWLEDFQPVLAGATGRTVIVGVDGGRVADPHREDRRRGQRRQPGGRRLDTSGRHGQRRRGGVAALAVGAGVAGRVVRRPGRGRRGGRWPSCATCWWPRRSSGCRGSSGAEVG